MPKILSISDHGVPTGYGRIADEVYTRLARRGHEVMAASLAYDGLLPPQYDGQQLPYWVAALAGRSWVDETVKLIRAFQPDIVHITQDFPYAEALRHAPVDWSRHAFMLTTPVDGAPIYPRWLQLLDLADGALTISQFGVAAFRAAGYRVGLCRPGVDPNRFYRMTDDLRRSLRGRLDLPAEAFVLGVMCMNQGRKAISLMLRGFFTFAADKPDARCLLDMDAVSAAGWDIPALCEQFGWDASKLIFRADAVRAGLTDLPMRYNLLDAHAVISHREGYGLPLAESMACGVATLALDYCSGPEIVGDGRGVLVKTIDYGVPGTWGGAEDRFPDLADFSARLERLHADPAWRESVARAGMAWARTQTWDSAADAVQRVVDSIAEKHR